MNNARFLQLQALIRLHFDPAGGTLVRLFTPGNRMYRLTCSVRRNPFGVARECMLWAGESLVYSGPLNDTRLRTALTQRHICRAEVTNVSREARGIIRSNPGMCLMDPAACKKKGKCRYKKC